MFVVKDILAKTFQGKNAKQFWPQAAIFCIKNERGDQGLSIGGKHDLVQCLELWQKAFENWFFLQNKLNFWKLLGHWRVKVLFFREEGKTQAFVSLIGRAATLYLNLKPYLLSLDFNFTV